MTRWVDADGHLLTEGFGAWALISGVCTLTQEMRSELVDLSNKLAFEVD